MRLAFVGILSNAIAIAANGGHMPIWLPSLEAAGFTRADLSSPFHSILLPELDAQFLLHAGPLADIREKVAMRQRGETDEPVTSDIKRLIRMPSSLHGKTGLQVVPLTRDAIDTFRPLRDAVPDTWTDDRTRVNLRNKVKGELRGESFDLPPGTNDVPQYLAIFLGARGLATIAT
jgi:hypothetical protein